MKGKFMQTMWSAMGGGGWGGKGDWGKGSWGGGGKGGDWGKGDSAAHEQGSSGGWFKPI